MQTTRENPECSPESVNAKRNVRAITTIEHAAMESRSGAERIADTIARQAGKISFVIAHAVWFFGWIAANSGFLPKVRAFDPFPYQFLTFVVSLEAIFLSLFILISQNRSSRQADARSHLDLQINLLAEQESTKMLQMLQSLCKYHHLAIADDAELESLIAPTEPAELLKELEAKLPGDC